MDLRAERIGFLVHRFERDAFDLGRMTEVERAERHVDGVASHVAECAGAEVLPAAPFEGVVNIFLERARRRATEPDVPRERIRHNVGAFGAAHALRPDGAICPDMDFADVADDAALDDFHRAANAIGGAALVAHLRDDILAFREIFQVARFVNRLHERLLAIDMFALAHRQRGDECVHVVRRGNRDAVNLAAQFGEHLAVILIKLCFGIFFALLVGAVGVHVAQGDDVLARAVIRVALAFAHDADARDVELAVQVFGAQQGGHAEDDRAGGERGGLEETAAAQCACGILPVGFHAPQSRPSAWKVKWKIMRFVFSPPLPSFRFPAQVRPGIGRWITSFEEQFESCANRRQTHRPVECRRNPDAVGPLSIASFLG